MDSNDVRKEEKNPTVALVLSFLFMGLGQFYNGEIKKGVIFLVSYMVSIVLMSVMVIDVSWQVASRFVFRAPSSFTEELAGFLLIWIGLLGAAYGFPTRAHLGIDLLVTFISAIEPLGVCSFVPVFRFCTATQLSDSVKK